MQVASVATGERVLSPRKGLEDGFGVDLAKKRKVLTPQKGEHFIFPIADGTPKLLRKDHEFREPALRQERPERTEEFTGELQGEPEGFQPTESRDDAEATKGFFGLCKVTLSIVITMNLKFNSMCRRNKDSLFH